MIKKYKSSFVVILIMLVYSITILFVQNSKSNRIKEQDLKITELNDEIKHQKTDVFSTSKVKDDVKMLTNIDQERFNSDNVKMKKAFKELFTWDDFKSYNKVRDLAYNKYKLDKNGKFLKEFMPVVETYKKGGYKGSKGDGKLYNVIDDTKANMSFKSLEPYVIRIDGSEYEYISTVSVNVKDMAGNNGKANFIVKYKTNGKSFYDLSVDYINEF